MFEASTYFYLFAFFALAGWLLEVCYRSVRAGAFVNPGFLKGPYLPLYGSAAMVLSLCIAHLPSGIEPPALNILVKALIYLSVTTGGELLTGLIFGTYLKKPLWDYSGQPLCYKNAVCLEFSCYWVILAFGFEYALLPGALYVHSLLNPAWLKALTFMVCLTISLDFGHQLALSLAERRGQPNAAKLVDQQEFKQILEPLLATKEVQSLAEYKHHRHKDRLEHSLEVAWQGYALSKKLSLDYGATARAALLHDLFFYDWLTEGPRLHGFRHPRISLENASLLTELSLKERDIIAKHMWPLTVVPPRYLESWIVCLADTHCSVKDYAMSLLRKFPDADC